MPQKYLSIWKRIENKKFWSIALFLFQNEIDTIQFLKYRYF